MNTKPFKISSVAKKPPQVKASSSQDKGKRKVSFKEKQENKYPFLNSDVVSMMDKLLKSKLIQLSEIKRHEETSRVNEPHYCRYHRLISRQVEKFFMLKNKIIEIYNDDNVEFDDEVASSNLASVTTIGS